MARGSRRVDGRTLEAVRRAVAGTLNREMDVDVQRLRGGRWTVTLRMGQTRSVPIGLEAWEMQAMRKVLLVPAHKRGIFLRHYTMLAGYGNAG